MSTEFGQQRKWLGLSAREVQSGEGIRGWSRRGRRRNTYWGRIGLKLILVSNRSKSTFVDRERMAHSQDSEAARCQTAIVWRVLEYLHSPNPTCSKTTMLDSAEERTIVDCLLQYAFVSRFRVVECMVGGSRGLASQIERNRERVEGNRGQKGTTHYYMLENPGDCRASSVQSSRGCRHALQSEQREA